MRIFLTGASGGLGSDLLPKLLAAGHSITALARSHDSAAKILSLGVQVVRGDMSNLDTISAAAAVADLVLHLAFDHERAFFKGDFAGAVEEEKAVMNAIGTALAADGATGKVFMYASGTLGVDGTDENADNHRSPFTPRYQSTDEAMKYVEQGIHVIQLRLAPITYGPEQPHHFITFWANAAKALGAVPYIDTGVWGACSYDDAAQCVLDTINARAKLANPTNVHVLEESGVPFRECAEAIAAKLGVPTKRFDAADFAQIQELGALAMIMTMTQPVKADLTRERTGWQPKGDGLVAQLGRYTYP